MFLSTAAPMMRIGTTMSAPMDMTAIVDIRKSKHDRASLMLQLFLQDITIGFLTGLVFK